MIANALLAATVIMLAIAFFLAQECQFLIPYRALLIGKYSAIIATFAAALFVNLFAAFYLIGRRLFLKDTGQKLAHLEKQLRSGATVSNELSERLNEDGHGA